MKFQPLIIIICVVAAFIASGCTGSEIAISGSSLIHTGNLTWYEYRENHTGVVDKYGVHDPIYHRYQFDNATYNGTIVPHLLLTQRLGGSHNVSYTCDNYFDPAGSVILYCHTERQEDGSIVMSGDDYNTSGSFWPNAYEVLYAVWSSNFTYAGKEKITIDGNSYECDKYCEIVELPGKTLLVWVDPDIPVPVKIGEEGNVWSSELVGRGR